MLFFFHSTEKMKTIIAVTVIFYLFAIASAQNANCVNRATEYTDCQTRIAAAAGDVATVCSECGDTIVSYLQQCANGVGVDQFKQGQLQDSLIILLWNQSS